MGRRAFGGAMGEKLDMVFIMKLWNGGTDMEFSKLMNLLKFDSDNIVQSFRKASVEGGGTPQEVSDRREANISIFLSKYFPFPYRIVKGNIIDSYDNNSNSIDCIILNPCHPYTIDQNNQRASIIFAEGVDVAIEVKSDFDNGEIIRGLKQIESVKKLIPRRPNSYNPQCVNLESKLYMHSIPTFLFSLSTCTDLYNTVRIIVDYYVEYQVPRLLQFDYIIVHNRCILRNVKNLVTQHYLVVISKELLYLNQMWIPWLFSYRFSIEFQRLKSQ